MVPGAGLLAVADGLATDWFGLLVLAGLPPGGAWRITPAPLFWAFIIVVPKPVKGRMVAVVGAATAAGLAAFPTGLGRARTADGRKGGFVKASGSQIYGTGGAAGDAGEFGKAEMPAMTCRLGILPTEFAGPGTTGLGIGFGKVITPEAVTIGN